MVHFINYLLFRATMAWRKRGRNDLDMLADLSERVRKESLDREETIHLRFTIVIQENQRTVEPSSRVFDVEVLSVPVNCEMII